MEHHGRSGFLREVWSMETSESMEENRRGYLGEIWSMTCSATEGSSVRRKRLTLIPATTRSAGHICANNSP
eukprot:613226-Rhodomonas_salina.1